MYAVLDSRTLEGWSYFGRSRLRGVPAGMRAARSVMPSSKGVLWVGVMARAPVAGRAKTRLIPLLGAKGAARFQGLCLLQTLSNIPPSATRVRVFGTPAPRVRAFLERHQIRVPVLVQRRGDLGTRLAHAFAALFRRRGGERVCLIGTDSPDLPRSFLEGARTGLTKSPSVLAPAADGGFTLIGLRRDAFSAGTERLWELRALFNDLPWSTPTTGAAMRSRLHDGGLSPKVLPRWWDLDEPSDFQRLARRMQRTAGTSLLTEFRDFVTLAGRSVSADRTRPRTPGRSKSRAAR